jgi:hypothetical protein
VKLAVMMPVPVAEGAENVLRAGVTVAAVEAAPVPAAFVALIVHEYVVLLLRLVSVMGLTTAVVAVTGPGVQESE